MWEEKKNIRKELVIEEHEKVWNLYISVLNSLAQKLSLTYIILPPTHWPPFGLMCICMDVLLSQNQLKVSRIWVIVSMTKLVLFVDKGTWVYRFIFCLATVDLYCTVS
ncbi:hypothetical protein ACOSQ4_021299 [Xanthoceras sorbifolium]